jgi:hypothetical protein
MITLNLAQNSIETDSAQISPTKDLPQTIVHLNKQPKKGKKKGGCSPSDE